MKSIITILFLFFTFSVFAQNEDALNKLSEYGIKEEMITKNLKDPDPDYYFKLKSTSITDTSNFTTLAEFDPSREVGKWWTLLEQNGKKPDEKAIKSYEKNQNGKTKDIDPKIIRSSWQILKDDGNETVLGFRYDEKSLPKSSRFLSDCQGKLFYDKNQGKITKVEYANDGPTKISIFKVDKLDLVIYYKWVEEDNNYLIDRQETTMQIRVLGNSAGSKEISEYLDYRKL